MKLLIKRIARNKVNFLLTIFFFGTVFHVAAMKRSFKGEDKGSVIKKHKTNDQIQDELQQHLAYLKTDEFFVYQEGTADGIVVSKNILELSETMKHLLELLLYSNDSNVQKLIPLPYSSTIIKQFFACLGLYLINPSNLIRAFEIIQSYPLSWLVETINCAVYLEVSPDIQKCLNNILDNRLKNMDVSTLQANMPVLNSLNPDIKRQIVFTWVKPCMELLGSHIMIDQKKEMPTTFETGFYRPDGKICILKLDTKEYYTLCDMRFGKTVTQKLKIPGDVVSVNFSAHNKLVIGYNTSSNNNGAFVVFNLSKKGKVTKEIVISMQNNFLDIVKINPQGDLVATLCDDKIILWDISDPDKAVSIELKDKKYTEHDMFLAMDFCSDNKTLFTGCAGRLSEHGLIEWDVSNLHDIKRNELTGEHQNINILSVACSANGKMYASASEGSTDNLLLWHKHYHQYYILQGHSSDVDNIVFTANGEIIISESDSDQSNKFIVWDIRDVNAVMPYYLPGYSSFIKHSMNISGGNIVCKYSDKKKYIIPVLSSSQLRLLDTVKECDLKQAQVIAVILEQKKANLPVRLDDKQIAVFMTLPDDIKTIMIDVFKILNIPQ